MQQYNIITLHTHASIQESGSNCFLEVAFLKATSRHITRGSSETSVKMLVHRDLYALFIRET